MHRDSRRESAAAQLSMFGLLCTWVGVIERMYVGKDTSKPVSRVWGVIGALLLLTIAGLLLWLVVQGIRSNAV